MKQLSIIIPIKNKETERLNEVIKKLDNDLVGEIIIVDYCSDTPFEYKNEKVVVIRYNKTNEWNKSHAINIGSRTAKFDYIMTMDADILIGPDFFNKVKKKLSPDAFIYTNKVMRIKKENLSKNWKQSLSKSFPWHKHINFRDEAFNLATGGFQIFPKNWFNKIKGLDENLIYYGGMDNITIIDARRSNMNLIILNETILHIEHDKQKEMNLPDDERDFASYIKSKRWELMETISKDNYKKPDSYGSIEGPNCPIIKQYKKDFKKLQSQNIQYKTVKFDKNTKIMIAVINNKSTLPELFVRSLIPMYLYTKKIFPNTDIRFVKSAQVNNMRNISVITAINEGYDYLIQLDDDHEYPENTIIKLLCHKKDFVTGCTRQRVAPYLPTQFYKFKNPMKQEGNYVKSNGGEGLIKIECSGPVGMLMKVSALQKLKHPYYWMDYNNTEYKLSKGLEEWTYYPRFISNYIGGDYVFCRSLLDSGNDLWLDTSLDFPHMIAGVVDGISDDGDANVRLNDGNQ